MATFVSPVDIPAGYIVTLSKDGEFVNIAPAPPPLCTDADCVFVPNGAHAHGPEGHLLRPDGAGWDDPEPDAK